MTKQMNEYVLLLKSDEASPLPAPAAAFNSQLAQWLQDSGAAEDVIRTEPAAVSPKVSVICTESLARRIAEAFSTVASITMGKENVITLPDPLPKKTRRAGFEAI